MIVKTFTTYQAALDYDIEVSGLRGYNGTTSRWCEPIPRDDGTFLVASHDGQGVEIEVY